MTANQHNVDPVLTPDDILQVERLLHECNQFEALELPFFLDPSTRSEAVPTEFVVRQDGLAIAYACLPDDPEPEACLMVHPGQRRRGNGRALLAALQTEGQRRGLSRFLVVADQAATSGRAFLTAVGAPYLSSEYRMALDRMAIDRSRGRHPLHMRLADLGDLAVLTRIRTAAFGGSEGEQRADLTRRLHEPNRHHYLAMLADEPIGMISVVRVGEGVDVTSFAVLPEHQRRGFGRQILLDTVEMLLAFGQEHIQIEVATDNARALGLYQSCGFTIQTEYGYYEIET